MSRENFSSRRTAGAGRGRGAPSPGRENPRGSVSAAPGGFPVLEELPPQAAMERTFRRTARAMARATAEMRQAARKAME